ncbi:MAG: Lrp/AsnC family transcriptional regulator [Proteobacteria bacterium]|nr:Lrp/AsnC family transcriptional regulator [Pseudomonadota bacterium]
MLVRFIKIKCLPATIDVVADDLVQLVEVREIYTMPGDYDLLVKCYFSESTNIGGFVQKKIQKISGVDGTFTMDTEPLFL